MPDGISLEYVQYNKEYDDDTLINDASGVEM